MRRSDGQRPQLRPLRQHPVLGRRLAEDVDPLALDQLQPLVGRRTALDDHRRRAAEPGREEDVARRLRPPGRRRAPDQLAGARPEPVLGLGPLAGQVALRVQRGSGLAGRPRGEDDQRRVVGVEVGDLGRRSPGRGPRRARPATSASVIVGDRRRAARASSASSPTQSAGFATPRAARGPCGEAAVLQGSATAPIRQQASIARTHSTRLPTRVMTTSPRPTPRAANAPERPADIAISSPKCQTRRARPRGDREQRRLRGREAARAGPRSGSRRSSLPHRDRVGR